jgi:ABC-type lipoprotein export system ATPase subunit
MTALLEFREIAFAYPARDARPGFTIRDLSFSVAAGEIFGVIGPNASGKTTLIRLLSRVLEPARGAILLDGENLGRLSRASVARRLAVVPQNVPAGFPYTVEELVLMGRFPHAPHRFFENTEDVDAGRQAMAAAGVLELRGEALDRLSGGERQRVMLARALCQRADRASGPASPGRVRGPAAAPQRRDRAHDRPDLARPQSGGGDVRSPAAPARGLDRRPWTRGRGARGVDARVRLRVPGRGGQASHQPAAHRADRLAKSRGEVIERHETYEILVM